MPVAIPVDAGNETSRIQHNCTYTGPPQPQAVEFTDATKQPENSANEAPQRGNLESCDQGYPDQKQRDTGPMDRAPECRVRTKHYLEYSRRHQQALDLRDSLRSTDSASIPDPVVAEPCEMQTFVAHQRRDRLFRDKRSEVRQVRAFPVCIAT